MNTLVLSSLSKCYGQSQIFSNFCHRFPEAVTTVITGPSGCGKTTLLRLILGLEPPDSGLILGTDNKRFSAVFQEPRLCEEASAFANLRFVAPQLTRPQAHALFAQVGLEAQDGIPVHTFSGGMKQRVSLLRALCAPYDYLLLDEPFQGLDEKTRQQTIEFFQRQTVGKTVLLVTHNPEEAACLGQAQLLLPAKNPMDCPPQRS